MAGRVILAAALVTLSVVGPRLYWTGREGKGPRRPVRYASWFMASLLVGLGLAIAAAIPPDQPMQRLLFVAVASALATIVLLLAYQRSGRTQTTSAALLIAAFAVPLLLIHEVPDTSACSPQRRVPCDPSVGLWHADLLAATFGILLAAAFALAVIGAARGDGSTLARPSTQPGGR